MSGQISRQYGLLTLALGLGIAAATPVRAQPFVWYGGQTFDYSEPAPPPRAIQRQLARQGFRVLGPLRLNGEVVLADAIDSNDNRVRLVIDPFDGSILQRFATAEPRPQRFVARRDGFDNPAVIRGPAKDYLDDGSIAPPTVKTLPGEPRAQRPKPRPEKRASEKPDVAKPGLAKPALGTAARAAPKTPPIQPPAPQPAQSARAAPQPATAQPKSPAFEGAASPNPGARTEAATIVRPNVTVTTAEQAKPAASAAPAKPAAASPAKAGYANGVPINPLD